MLRQLSIFLLSTLFLSGQKTPAELDAHLQKLAPDLIDSTIAILIGGGSGSGVIVSPDGLVITAAHVTANPNQPTTVLLSDGRELPATSLGVDHNTDGALLQINAPGPFPYRPYVKEKDYQVGDWVIATGHPGGPIIGRPPPFRLGRIYADGTKSGFSDPLTTSAMVISGDSGGPLFNLRGEVIGINSNISGAWTVNNHVPMPSIIKKWDALLAGELIGRPQQSAPQETDDFFDEPFRNLRDQFQKALADRPADDREAQALRARPRLRDPHHLQAYLDKWKPDPEAAKTPRLGFKFDLTGSEPRVSEVIPDSPAEKAGLKKGDTIVRLQKSRINTPTEFGTILNELKKLPRFPKSIEIDTSSGRLVEITPEFIPERRHFPAPVAGLIPMLIGNSAGTSPPSIRTLEREFHEPLNELRDELRNSTAPIYHGEQLLIYATSVIGSQLITKASEIEKKEPLTIRLGEQESPVRIISIDQKRDLALISCDLEGLQPVDLRVDLAPVASLVLTPGRKELTPGVITQPARPAPAKGYEHNVEPDQPRGYVGIVLSQEEDAPTIAQVELDSPADSAGLLEGDIITALNGKTVKQTEDLAAQLNDSSPGQKVTFKVKRDEEEIDISLILDPRPAKSATKKDRRAEMRDASLSSLTASGGSISKRRADFPLALYHDTRLQANEMGTPLLNADGEFLGLNIARALRHRTLALPASEIRAFYREQLIKEWNTD